MYSSGLGLGYGSGFGIRARAWDVLSARGNLAAVEDHPRIEQVDCPLNGALHNLQGWSRLWGGAIMRCVYSGGLEPS